MFNESSKNKLDNEIGQQLFIGLVKFVRVPKEISFFQKLLTFVTSASWRCEVNSSAMTSRCYTSST